jgi:hypothetical protein
VRRTNLYRFRLIVALGLVLGAYAPRMTRAQTDDAAIASARKLERARAITQVIIEPAVARLDNGLIAVQADDDGQFWITRNAFTEPDPDRRRLTAEPWSSFAVAQVVADGITSTHSLRDLTPTVPSRVVNGAIETVWQLPAVRITQTLAIVPNEYTLLSDTIRIAYALGNSSAQPVRSGLRLMVDVYSGGEPESVLMARQGLIESQPTSLDPVPGARMVVGSGTRLSWQSAAAGRLQVDGFAPPDQLLYGEWTSDERWVPNIAQLNPVPNGDKAVHLIWKLRELPGNSAVDAAFTFGAPSLSGQDTLNPLIEAPRLLRPQTEPFFVTFWRRTPVRTSRGNPVSVTLSLPPGLALASSHPAGVRVPADYESAIFSAEWRVMRTSPELRGSYNITITLVEEFVQTPLTEYPITLFAGDLRTTYMPVLMRQANQ